MFRGFGIEDNKIRFEAVLYKNKREKIGIINNDWIVSVDRLLEDIDYMELEIPKYVNNGMGEKRLNNIYVKISAMHQIVVTETNKLNQEEKSRFVLVETTKNFDKKRGIKKFKAMSFEYKLKSKRTSFEGKVMQLKSDEVHIGDGILDKFIKECSDWSIGYVDEKSRTETRLGIENVNVNLFNDYTNNKITNGSVIWEKEVTTSIEEGLPLYLSIEYKNIGIYDENDDLLISNNIINQIVDPLYKNIKKITAKHFSDVGNRFGIEYEFTLTDDVKVSRILTFTNVIDKKINVENIKLVWETGKVIENTSVKYINIEKIDSSWYDALLTLQDQFNSVVMFDGYNKTISVIHRDNLGKNSGYLLSYDSNIIDANVTESCSYPNSLKIIGKDGLTVRSENIFGGDIIYDYSYYIDNNIMSKSLQEAWGRYEKYLVGMNDVYLNIKNERMTYQQRKTKLDSEITTLNERVKTLNNLLSAYISANDAENQSRIKAEMDEVKARLEECLLTRNNYQKLIDFNDDLMINIAGEIKQENASDEKGKIFTQEDLDELRELEVTEVYDDNYYTTPYALIQHSKNVLKDMVKPEIDFDLNCVDLSKVIRNPKGWNKVLYLGDLFNIEDGLLEDYKDNQIRLVSYKYSPREDKVSNISFSNKFKKIDIKKSISNIGKQSNENTNVIGSYKQIWEDAMLSSNWVGEVITNGLDLAANIIKGRGSRNYIDISEAGIFITDQQDVNKQIYIGSSLIGISNDGFATSEIAIDSNGIMAKLLIGKIILGEKLYITSELGEFYIGNMENNKGFGLNIKDSNKKERIFLGTEEYNGVRMARFRLMSADGREVVISEEGIISHNSFIFVDDLDSEHPIEFDYVVQDGTFSVRDCRMTLALKPYRMTVRATKSGGNANTNISGGGSTSESAGHYTSNENKTSEGQNWLGQAYEGYFSTSLKYDYTVDGAGDHYHRVDASLLDHTHMFSYTVSIPNHTHSIPDHSHKLDLSHTHTMEAGIFESTTPNNCAVYVNDKLVASNINSDTTVSIGENLKVGVNKIKITSSRLGRIQSTVFSKSFVAY